MQEVEEDTEVLVENTEVLVEDTEVMMEDTVDVEAISEDMVDVGASVWEYQYELFNQIHKMFLKFMTIG